MHLSEVKCTVCDFHRAQRSSLRRDARQGNELAHLQTLAERVCALGLDSEDLGVPPAGLSHALQHADEQAAASDRARHDVRAAVALLRHLLRDFFEDGLVACPHVLVVEGRHVHSFFASGLRLRQHDVLEVGDGFFETLTFLDHLSGARGSNFSYHHRFC